MNAFARGLNKTLHVWEGFKQTTPASAASTASRPRNAHPAPVNATPPSSVAIPHDVIVSPFDCNIYTPTGTAPLSHPHPTPAVT